MGALNMFPTKKRVRSPEVDGPLSTHQSTSIRIHQNAPLKRSCCRGPKDDRIKALQKLECRHRSKVFYHTSNNPIVAHAHQISTCVRPTAPAIVQSSSGHPVPHPPPPLPEEGDEGGLEVSNGSPVSPHVPLGSSLGTASSIRENWALFRQIHHLDDHTPVWNQCRNNQATQWQSITIPQLIPIYLANHVATESGRSPPPPMPNHQCQCKKVALKVEMVTWDHKFSLDLLQLFANCVLHQDHCNRYCPSVNAIQLVYS
jgi:hypothetical protein